MEASVRIWQIILLSALLAAAAAVDVSAQTVDDPRWTFGGTIGAGRTWDDEGPIGSGWLAGGYATRRLSPRVDVELAVDVQRHDRSGSPGSGYEAKGHTTYLSASAIRRFGSRSANCFILGGGAIGIHRGTTGFIYEPVRVESNDTHGGIIFGGGLAFRTAGGLEISTPVRITLMGVDDDSDPVSSIMGGVRIGFGR
jgi:hypothetical protein